MVYLKFHFPVLASIYLLVPVDFCVCWRGGRGEIFFTYNPVTSKENFTSFYLIFTAFVAVIVVKTTFS